jgi:site-specific DNA-methyltransferase (adenine-specific)
MTEPDILSPFVETHGVTVYQGDCIETMRRLPENSVDAIVTDPPYGLEFMGKEWDSFAEGRGKKYKSGGKLTHTDFKNLGTLPSYTSRPAKRCAKCGKQAWSGSPCQCDAPEWVIDNSPLRAFQSFSEAWAREAFRVLKPGGHLLAFAGTRTYHRMASGVEDAGFEIRDCIAWMYGSGFPKSLDVSKAIDKAAGAERKVVGTKLGTPGYSLASNDKVYRNSYGTFGDAEGECAVTAPATPEAVKWSGWGTALKPAFEPIVVARKPLIGTVAQNVLEHGTGALNIDATRIGTDTVGWSGGGRDGNSVTAGASRGGTSGGYNFSDGIARPAAGRWPANVVLDAEAGAILDEQSGDSVAGQPTAERGRGGIWSASADGIPAGPQYGDRCGASRFFYCAKASKKDRNTNGAANTHPTVKPTELMRWLIRLVTPPGGIILDPFGGSGSTGVAAQADSVRCILIEREDEYLSIIRERLDDGGLFSQLP